MDEVDFDTCLLTLNFGVFLPTVVISEQGVNKYLIKHLLQSLWLAEEIMS